MTDKTVQDAAVPQAGTKLADVEALQKQLDAARADAAKYRTAARDGKATIETLTPLADKAKEMEESQKSELEKLTDKLAAMQLQVETGQAAVEAVQRQNKVQALAYRANVPDDVLQMLDMSKIDVDDPEEAVKKLSVFSKPSSSSSTVVNPEKQNGASMSRQAFTALSVEERVKAVTDNPNLVNELT